MPTHRLILSLPPTNLNDVSFPSQIHCIALRWSTFQRVSRSVDVRSIDVLHVWQFFLFWNQISYFKDHVYSSLIVKMKWERCQFWKRYFENQPFWSKTQHTSFKICSPLIVLYFENRNWPIVRLKFLFLWFFVSILIFDFGYIIW